MEHDPAPAAPGGVAVMQRRARGGMPLALFVVAVACSAAACTRADAPASEDDAAASQVAAPAPAAAGASPAEVAPALEPSVTAPPAAPAVVDTLSSPEHQRYQQLRLQTLRLMIEAAKQALPIGSFQQRIDAAARTALQDVSEAGDRMEEVAADLQQMLAENRD